MSDHPLFMSRRHVDVLNRRLAESEAVAALCAGLERDLSLLYEMSDESNGGQVCWRTDFLRTGGIVFSLEHGKGMPDVVISGGYWSIIDALQGKGAMPEPLGDPEVIARIMALLTSTEIRPCAVQVTWPARTG